MLGASSVMGWGIADDETFENLLESRLNTERGGRGWQRYEVLNFAVSGYRPLQNLWLLDRVLEFRPNAVFYVGTKIENRGIDYLVKVVGRGIPSPWPYLDEVVRRAGIDATTEESHAIRQLTPFRGELLSWVYEQFVDKCRAANVLPIFVYEPGPTEDPTVPAIADIKQRAAAAGFTVLDLSGAFDGHDPSTLILAHWDEHPNARAHALLAGKLYSLLRDREHEIYPATVTTSRPAAALSGMAQ
jgi:hypothetical protein